MEAVIFDLDGTILNTSEGVIESVLYAARKLGYGEISSSIIEEFIGTPIQMIFEKIYHSNKKDAQNAAEIFRDYYLKYAIPKAFVYEGVYSLMEELVQRDKKIAVATYKREDCALAMLKFFNLQKYLTSIHGADNYNKLTKTEVIQMCFKELGVEKSNVVLVGDTNHDAISAKNAGIAFIGVTYGIGFKDKSEFDKYPNIGCVDKIKDILIYL